METKYLVILSAFNEQDKIGKLIKEIKGQNLPLDILAVDDGSLDKTQEAIRQHNVRLITHTKNLGKGSSLRDGFNEAIEKKYDFVITMDSDGQHNPEELKKFLDKETETSADVIVGNRLHNPKNMPFIRKITNILMSKIISKICRQEIPDSQSGYRLIKAEVIKKIELDSQRYDIESELLIKSANAGFKISWVPIESIYKGQVSFINPVIDAFRFLRLIFKNAIRK